MTFSARCACGSVLVSGPSPHLTTSLSTIYGKIMVALGLAAAMKDHAITGLTDFSRRTALSQEEKMARLESLRTCSYHQSLMILEELQEASETLGSLLSSLEEGRLKSLSATSLEERT